MGKKKPLIQAACICENVLIDADGTASLIRIIDKFQATVPKDLPEGIPAGFPVKIFIRLGSGNFKGKGTLSIQSKRPDGTIGGKVDVPVDLPGGTQGVQINTGFLVLKPQNGVYWFDVSWDDEILTSFAGEVILVEGPPTPAATSLTATPAQIAG
jgi:hypothetical protein